MVTTTQYNAGLYLINAKKLELQSLHKKLDRVAVLAERIAKDEDMPYTEENIETLFMHSLKAIFSHNLPMMIFWMNCMHHVRTDIQSNIRMELIHRHQAARIIKLAMNISDRAELLEKAIASISANISG